ncbi:MAG: hypothetical protein ACFCUE_08425 [Candidatus Bathyarchaeia archaeon]|jgi:hypothetical protein
MRLNTKRLGLILVIIGAITLFNVWTARVCEIRTQLDTIESGETFAYGLFIAPVGLGNITFDGEVLKVIPGSPAPITVNVAVPIHVAVVSPSGVVLVDEEAVTPCSFKVNFVERGEYVVNVTNMSDEDNPIPVAVEYPKDTGVVYREADKFLVSVILTVSGVALFCLGLSTTLIAKQKNKTKLIPHP